MKAVNVCQRAATLVGGERAEAYGDMHANMQRVAEMWSSYLGVEGVIRGTDVAVMMAILKICRIRTGSHQQDNFIDLVGYGAIAGELAERANAPKAGS